MVNRNHSKSILKKQGKTIHRFTFYFYFYTIFDKLTLANVKKTIEGCTLE